MKSLFHRISVIIYIAAMALCALILVKPGAAIFYYKLEVKKQDISPDAGYAYRYEINLNRLIFRTSEALLYEDRSQLDRVAGGSVVDTGKGTYSLDVSPGKTDYVYFSSVDNSNPVTNDRKYTLYLPLRIVSRRTSLVGLSLLFTGMIGFLSFAFVKPDHRQTMLHSPRGFLVVLDHFFEDISQVLRSYFDAVWQQIKSRGTYWQKLFTFTIFAAYFFIFMEWLFFVTKPSFMSMLGLGEKFEIFILSCLFLSLLGMVTSAAFILLDLVFILVRLPVITRYLVAFIPTTILAVLAFLMVDNFTYTVFKFGISTSAGVGRGAYTLLFIVIIVYIYYQMLGYFGLARRRIPMSETSFKRYFYVASLIVIISTGFALARLDFSQLSTAETSPVSRQATRKPNIILLGSDGVSADHMSVYGYWRDTTPRLREIASSSLVAENTFTNSRTTAGAIISIFTSKLPTQTRLLYAPDILTGDNAYQHLPGLLKAAGYKNVEFGVPNYVDAYSLNVQDGFDRVNGLTRGNQKTAVFSRALGQENVAYFLYKIYDRVSERLQHIIFIRTMQNPYQIVTQPAPGISDEDKIKQMLDLVEKSSVPVFVHVHLLGTHGARFEPPIRVFSAGEQQNQDWMVDFYDDAVLSFDTYVGQIIDQLKADGRYEDTILIIYSDHAMDYQANWRIPLIIHFPGDDHAGKISQIVQNLDIAPTLLDYIGVPIPAWMDGTSLLSGQLDDNRIIFITGTDKVEVDQQGLFLLDPQLVKPPFYQFSNIYVINCQNWYKLDLTTFDLIFGEVPGYTSPCSVGNLLSADEIRQLITQRLSKDGFDVSSLP